MAQVTLGDVAIESRETYKGDKSGMPIVGLEHLIPEDVVLSLWDRDKENTFTKMFRKGDMLFGRRRAYLKKAAQAPFDGICSGDITVIRAKEDRLIPELLPFIIQNDVLFDFAVGKSAGSLSPRVKWENLKNYKFELPPLPEQKKLAEALWAINDTLQAYQKLLIETDELVKSQFIEMFGDPIANPKHLPVKKLSDLASLITKGASPNWQGYGYTEDVSQTLFVTSENVREGQLDLSSPKYLEDGFNEKQKRSMLHKGDFLINIVGASIGRAARFDLDVKANINQAVALVRMNEDEVISNYMMYYLNSPKALEMYESMKSSVARANLSLQNIGDLEILIPPIDEQKQFAQFIKQSDKSKFALQNAISAARETKRSIIADALGIKGKE